MEVGGGKKRTPPGKESSPLLAPSSDRVALTGQNVGFICQKLYAEILLGFFFFSLREFSFPFNCTGFAFALSDFLEPDWLCLTTLFGISWE